MVIYTAAEILALRRRQPPDFWQSVTGSLRWTETDPLEAARRELFEETGLGEGLNIVDCGVVNRFPILPDWRDRYAPDVVENIERVFRVQLPAPRPVTLNPAEHTEYAWWPREVAVVRMSSWSNRAAISALPR